jgi:2-haloacid dehalogenase
MVLSGELTMDGHLNPSRHGVNRRIVLAAAMIPLITRAAVAQTSSGVNPGQLHPKALTFDIQGTTLDFHQPLLQIGQTISAHGSPALDWNKFSAQWLAGAGRIVTEVREGQRAWMSAGAVYQAALDHLTQAGGPAAGLSEADKAELMTVWVRMVPWPDTLQGIARLKNKYTVAALSNGTMAGVIAVCKRDNLSFDAILASDLVHSYKPSPALYNSAVSYLGFEPGQIMMVACHKWDLKAAKAQGLMTAYVPRPLENGPGHPVDRAPESYIDVMANDFVDLATKLNA